MTKMTRYTPTLSVRARRRLRKVAELELRRQKALAVIFLVPLIAIVWLLKAWVLPALIIGWLIGAVIRHPTAALLGSLRGAGVWTRWPRRWW